LLAGCRAYLLDLFRQKGANADATIIAVGNFDFGTS
jgi:hypothetical protein